MDSSSYKRTVYIQYFKLSRKSSTLKRRMAEVPIIPKIESCWDCPWSVEVKSSSLRDTSVSLTPKCSKKSDINKLLFFYSAFLTKGTLPSHQRLASKELLWNDNAEPSDQENPNTLYTAHLFAKSFSSFVSYHLPNYSHDMLPKQKMELLKEPKTSNWMSVQGSWSCEGGRKEWEGEDASLT